MAKVKVRFLEALFAEQTNTHYLKGAEVEVPEDLAKRHDKDGTGILEILSDVPETKAPPKVKVIK